MLLGFAEPVNVYNTNKHGGTGKKTHETNANEKINIPTQMVKQYLCGGVFIYASRVCGIEQ